MLIKAIEDLEQEATERVRSLEQKLTRAATVEKEVSFEILSHLLLPFNAYFKKSRSFFAILLRVLCEKVQPSILCLPIQESCER